MDKMLGEWLELVSENFLKHVPQVDLVVYIVNSKYIRANKRKRKIILRTLKSRRFSNLLPKDVSDVEKFVNNNDKIFGTFEFCNKVNSNDNNKKVLEVFIDSLSISRGVNPPSVNETTITTVYTDGTINIKKESE